MAEPLRYYHNITANVVNVLEAMQASSTRQVRRGARTLDLHAGRAGFSHSWNWLRAF